MIEQQRPEDVERDARRAAIGSVLHRIAGVIVAGFPEFTAGNAVLALGGNPTDGVELFVLSPENDEWIQRRDTVTILCHALRFVAASCPEERRDDILKVIDEAINVRRTDG
jgi:hypothetical protein